ncbi:MAG: hypothetical protein ACK5MQ_13005 [Pikeienuella sp.]
MSSISITFSFADLLAITFVFIPGIAVFPLGGAFALMNIPAGLRLFAPKRVVIFFLLLLLVDLAVAFVGSAVSPLVEWYMDGEFDKLLLRAFLRLLIEAAAAASIQRWIGNPAR